MPAKEQALDTTDEFKVNILGYAPAGIIEKIFPEDFHLLTKKQDQIDEDTVVDMAYRLCHSKAGRHLSIFNAYLELIFNLKVTLAYYFLTSFAHFEKDENGLVMISHNYKNSRVNTKKVIEFTNQHSKALAEIIIRNDDEWSKTLNQRIATREVSETAERT